MSESKKHHHLSKFYIEGFSENNTVFVLSKEDGRIFESNTKDVFTKRKYYYLDDFENPSIVEEEIGKIESAAAPIIKKICRGGEQDLSLTEKDTDGVLRWIAWLYISRPKHRNLIDKHLEQVEKVARCFLLDKGVNEEESQFMKQLKEEKKGRVAHIRRTLDIYNDILMFIKSLQWRAISLTHDTDLITSDSPFHRIPNFQQGQIPSCYDPVLHLVLLFPLSKRCLLIGSGVEIDQTFNFDCLVTKEYIQMINDFIFKNTYKFLVSAKRSYLEKYIA